MYQIGHWFSYHLSSKPSIRTSILLLYFLNPCSSCSTFCVMCGSSDHWSSSKLDHDCSWCNLKWPFATQNAHNDYKEQQKNSPSCHISKILKFCFTISTRVNLMSSFLLTLLCVRMFQDNTICVLPQISKHCLNGLLGLWVLPAKNQIE